MHIAIKTHQNIQFIIEYKLQVNENKHKTLGCEDVIEQIFNEQYQKIFADLPGISNMYVIGLAFNPLEKNAITEIFVRKFHGSFSEKNQINKWEKIYTK